MAETYAHAGCCGQDHGHTDGHNHEVGEFSLREVLPPVAIATTLFPNRPDIQHALCHC